ncbi:maleylpyruvate isomerase N-terminal domain-containing protein [Streptomyces virginiae]|uniref:maleylpyruvate isomerase N-terminal domain-containing protein n=1 Tax=Streptomyces virginiae TaxID=1961 RepID=UPI0033ADEA69
MWTCRLFRKGAGQVGAPLRRAVRAVKGDRWDAPTPCTEWTVRDLVNHVTGEQLLIPPLIAGGRTLEELGDAFPGDVPGDDPVAAWDARPAARTRRPGCSRGWCARADPRRVTGVRRPTTGIDDQIIV